MGPPDPIFGLVEAFNKDPNPNKVSLVAGAYRDDNGKPYVLPTVKKVERMIEAKDLNKEYAGITGVPEYVQASVEFALTKDSPVVKEKRFAASQAISGTGALRLGAMFLHKFYPFEKAIYLPAPSWANHTPIFKQNSFDVRSYRYYDADTCLANFGAMCEDLKTIPDSSLVLLHACAHNPTGCDLNKEQWSELSQLFKAKKHFPFFDMAYQGFATGDVDNDAFPVRKFAEDGHLMILAQSYSKNMGLYGERVGCTTIVSSSEAEAKAIESQMKIIIRPLYSNPPIHGARIAKEVLTTPEYYAEWLLEVKGMADRIIDMRKALVDSLKKTGSSRDWSHVQKQIGMFAYTGLSPEQVDDIRSKYSIYMTKDGRMSVAGLSTKNVDIVAKAMHEVTM
jgi:aspartate aminotransferase